MVLLGHITFCNEVVVCLCVLLFCCLLLYFIIGSSLHLKDHDYLKLQFLGARNAWLGCAGDECGLATCPSINSNYRHFGAGCWGEEFQIIGEGTIHSSIKSGQQIRLRYIHEHNEWISCSSSNQCGKGTCSGTTAQGNDFSRCYKEIFKIYARGKRNGEVVNNNDVVVLFNNHVYKYLSIQGERNGDFSSLDFCPGIPPPAYLSFGICSKNAFRIYRKP